MYFDFSDCCHVALLAANCNCQLKQWGKLLPLPSTADVHVSTAGTAVYFLGWLKEEYFFHILLHWFCILLWKGLLWTAWWLSAKKVHVFVMLSPHTMSQFNLFTLPCTEVASGSWYSKNFMWRLWSSLVLLVGWGLVTDFKLPPEFINENCHQFGADSSVGTQQQKMCCSWAWWDGQVLSVVIEGQQQQMGGG